MVVVEFCSSGDDDDRSLRSPLPPSSFNSSPYIIIFWSNKKKATIETRTRKATRVVAALP